MDRFTVIVAICHIRNQFGQMTLFRREIDIMYMRNNYCHKIRVSSGLMEITGREQITDNLNAYGFPKFLFITI